MSSMSSSSSSSSRRPPYQLCWLIFPLPELWGEGGGGGGEGGIIAYKPNQATSSKLNAFLHILQLNKIMEFLLVFVGGKPMWIHRTAILARIFDCTPRNLR